VTAAARRAGGWGPAVVVFVLVIAAWEGDLDYAKAAEVLDGHELVDVTAG